MIVFSLLTISITGCYQSHELGDEPVPCRSLEHVTVEVTSTVCDVTRRECDTVMGSLGDVTVTGDVVEVVVTSACECHYALHVGHALASQLVVPRDLEYYASAHVERGTDGAVVETRIDTAPNTGGIVPLLQAWIYVHDQDTIPPLTPPAVTWALGDVVCGDASGDAPTARSLRVTFPTAEVVEARPGETTAGPTIGDHTWLLHDARTYVGCGHCGFSLRPDIAFAAARVSP